MVRHDLGLDPSEGNCRPVMTLADDHGDFRRLKQLYLMKTVNPVQRVLLP